MFDANDLGSAFFAIVDLLAILPFYIEVALQEDTVSPTHPFVRPWKRWEGLIRYRNVLGLAGTDDLVPVFHPEDIKATPSVPSVQVSESNALVRHLSSPCQKRGRAS
jgi:hypothetical protein